MNEESGIRRFVAYYFYYALMTSNDDRQDNPNLPVYSVDEMHKLAGEIPDLSKAFFKNVRDFGRILNKPTRREISTHGLGGHAYFMTMQKELNSIVRAPFDASRMERMGKKSIPAWYNTDCKL